MIGRRLSAVSLAAALVTACQFPQPQSSSGSSGPQMPSSSSPSGSSSPSSPTSSPSGSPSTPSGGASMPSGPSGPQMPDSSSGGSAGDSGTLGGEPLEWPSGGEEGGGLEDLDAQLDEALGDFDESMGQAGGAAEEEIDILNPMSSGSSSSSTDQPVFEDAGSEGESGESSMSENQGIAERASSGPSGSSSSSSGQQGGGGASGGESTSSGQDGGSSSSAGGGGGSAPTADRAETGSGQDEGGDVDVIPIPDDVGDGRDDDIVLKQIREAAMKEADPVLREKLWDEYRRIKGQR